MDKLDKLLKFVTSLSESAQLSGEGWPQEDAHETGNFDDAWQQGYWQAESEIGSEAEELLKEIGEFKFKVK